MSSTEASRPVGFHVMTKPSGPLCNIDCKYCFYLEKSKLFPDEKHWRMPDDVLERYIQQYIDAQDLPEVQFAWQGGEPTVLGVSYFEKVVELQAKYANGKTIANAFQTNGTLLNDAWGEFLHRNNFLVGLSIDGPQAIHDAYRVDKQGKPTFQKVMRGMEILKKHKVEFNTLTCINRKNATQALDVYRFLRKEGSGHMQFIPIVERRAEGCESNELELVLPGSPMEAKVTAWSVRPDEFGQFMSTIFDEWVRHDVGKVFVQTFEVSLMAWMGMEPNLCIFQKECGLGLALEHNGDLYSCDHFVYPEHQLGNIMEKTIAEMVSSPQQKQFGKDKLETLPQYCLDCDVRFICNGDCPKHRFTTTPDGEEGLSYLCAGYKAFFHHIDPYMKIMAKELRAGRPATSIMAYARQQDLAAAGQKTPGPNDPCICGSSRKYKKCCGRGR